MYTSANQSVSEQSLTEKEYKKVSRLKVVFSTTIMSLQITKRYKANLIGGLLEMSILAVVFGLFAGAMEFKNNLAYMTHDMIFIFFLGAIVLIIFNGVALWGPVETVRRDLYNGTLEYLYFNPINTYYYMIGNVLGDAIIRFFFLFLPMFVVMMVFIQVEVQYLVAIGIIALITLSTLMSLGILVSLTVVLWKDVRGLIGIIGLLFQFLGGAFFPVQTFPEPVQLLALVLPYTLGFDLIRWASFGGNWITILPLEIELLLLVSYALLYLLVSVFLMKRVIRHAKTKGLHLI